MVILTDDQENPLSIPTKANILRAMQWLVKDAQPNDSLFIHFSGERSGQRVFPRANWFQAMVGERQTWMEMRKMVSDFSPANGATI